MKPLVNGSISLKNAKGIVFSSVVLIFVLTIVFFFGQALILIPIGLVALAFGGVYDNLGKRLPHADYFIALMFFFAALYGGFSVSTTFGLFVYVIALLAMVQMLINNIIATKKDIKMILRLVPFLILVLKRYLLKMYLHGRTMQPGMQ